MYNVDDLFNIRKVREEGVIFIFLLQLQREQETET